MVAGCVVAAAAAAQDAALQTGWGMGVVLIGRSHAVVTATMHHNTVITSCQLLLRTQREDDDAFGVAKCSKAVMQERPGPPNPWLCCHNAYVRHVKDVWELS
jgi:hypothetical protein